MTENSIVSCQAVAVVCIKGLGFFSYSDRKHPDPPQAFSHHHPKVELRAGRTLMKILSLLVCHKWVQVRSAIWRSAKLQTDRQTYVAQDPLSTAAEGLQCGTGPYGNPPTVPRVRWAPSSRLSCSLLGPANFTKQRFSWVWSLHTRILY